VGQFENMVIELNISVISASFLGGLSVEVSSTQSNAEIYAEIAERISRKIKTSFQTERDPILRYFTFIEVRGT
jgi:hypothetical protein